MGMHGWRHRKGLHKGNLVSLDLEAGETEVWGERKGRCVGRDTEGESNKRPPSPLNSSLPLLPAWFGFFVPRAAHQP